MRRFILSSHSCCFFCFIIRSINSSICYNKSQEFDEASKKTDAQEVKIPLVWTKLDGMMRDNKTFHQLFKYSTPTKVKLCHQNYNQGQAAHSAQKCNATVERTLGT